MDASEVEAILERDAALCGAHLSGIAFPSPAAAEALRFEEVRFESVDFTAAELVGAEFIACSFHGSDLSRIQCAEARFVDCSFYDHDASAGCILRFADLEATRFERCDLSLCDLHGIRAWNMAWEDCVAQGISLDRAGFSRHPNRNLTLTAFTAHRCNLSFAEITGVHLVGADLSGSRLREALLDDVDLTDADLSGCDLSGIQARRLTLAGADLRDATIDGLDPRLIDLTGVRIRSWQQQALLAAMGIRVED